MSFSSSKSQFRTTIYKENITKNKIPKTSEKTSNPRKLKKKPQKPLKTSDISLVSRDIGNTGLHSCNACVPARLLRGCTT